MNLSNKFELLDYLNNNPGSSLFPKLAELHLKDGESEEALDVCRTGLRYNENSAIGHYFFAKAAIMEADYDAAIRHLKSCVRLDPEFLSAYRLLLEILPRDTDDKEIKLYCNAILRINPEDLDAKEKLEKLTGGMKTPSEETEEAVSLTEPEEEVETKEEKPFEDEEFDLAEWGLADEESEVSDEEPSQIGAESDISEMEVETETVPEETVVPEVPEEPPVEEPVEETPETPAFEEESDEISEEELSTETAGTEESAVEAEEFETPQEMAEEETLPPEEAPEVEQKVPKSAQSLEGLFEELRSGKKKDLSVIDEESHEELPSEEMEEEKPIISEDKEPAETESIADKKEPLVSEETAKEEPERGEDDHFKQLFQKIKSPDYHPGLSKPPQKAQEPSEEKSAETIEKKPEAQEPKTEEESAEEKIEDKEIKKPAAKTAKAKRKKTDTTKKKSSKAGVKSSAKSSKTKNKSDVKSAVKITPELATWTMYAIYKKQELYENALAILDILETKKPEDKPRVKIERELLQKLIEEKQETGE